MRLQTEIRVLYFFSWLLTSLASPSLPPSSETSDPDNTFPSPEVDDIALNPPSAALKPHSDVARSSSSSTLQPRAKKMLPSGKASYQGGPWTLHVYTCVGDDYNGQCNLFDFKGPDWKTTSQSWQTWRSGNESPKSLKNHDWDVGSFGPDPGLICGLTLLNCASGDKKCRLYGIESPGLRSVPEPWRSQTATMTCYMKGSKHWEDMKKQW